jgi:hypothetical protein
MRQSSETRDKAVGHATKQWDIRQSSSIKRSVASF